MTWAMLNWEAETNEPFRVASIAQIQAELSGVVVRELPNTTHMSILFVNTDSLVKMIRDFLLEADGTNRSPGFASSWKAW